MSTTNSPDYNNTPSTHLNVGWEIGVILALVIIAGGLTAAAIYETRRRNRRRRQREMLLEAGGEDARLEQGEEMTSIDQSLPSLSRPEQARSRDNARIERPPYYWVRKDPDS